MSDHLRIHGTGAPRSGGIGRRPRVEQDARHLRSPGFLLDVGHGLQFPEMMSVAQAVSDPSSLPHDDRLS